LILQIHRAAKTAWWISFFVKKQEFFMKNLQIIERRIAVFVQKVENFLKT